MKRILLNGRSQVENEKGVKLAIVGPGRLGQAMGKALREAGVGIGCVAGRRIGQARHAVRFIGCGKAISLSSPHLGKSSVVLMTVSDSAVEPVSRQVALCRADWTGCVVLHTCGSLPASVLEPFKLRGAWIGSLHPYQTVPSPQAGARNLRGCYWAVEGDRRAKAQAKRWVKVLGGTCFEVAPETKPLYHLSAFLVCPSVVALMDCSEKLLQQAGVPPGIAKPMLAQFVQETARNFNQLGGYKALTGPAVRGDWKTLERHLAELRRSAPEVVPAYRELVRLMLKVAGAPEAKPSILK